MRSSDKCSENILEKLYEFQREEILLVLIKPRFSKFTNAQLIEVDRYLLSADYIITVGPSVLLFVYVLICVQLSRNEYHSNLTQVF